MYAKVVHAEIPYFQPKGLVHRAKIGCHTKNVDFFKVRDTLTII